jgi:hypothetical protein
MKAVFCEPENKWRILIPPSISETGKRQARFFDTKEEAEAEAERIEEANGSDSAADITDEDRYLLKLIKSGKSAAQVLEAIKLGEKVGGSIPAEKRVDLETACLAFIDRQVHEKKNRRTVYSDRQALRKLSTALGPKTSFVEVTGQMLDDYITKMPPGGTRRTQYARVKKFINWAWRAHYLAVNPWEKSEPLDKWGSNSDFIKIEHYRRILFCLAGLEPLQEGQEPTTKYIRLLGYYVLGGLAGMRRCELIDSDPADPVLEWSHILWAKNQIYVPDEVAKQTEAQDKKRFIPLEPASKAWLALCRADRGRIVDMSQSTFQRLNDDFLDALNDGLKRSQKVVVPNNGLRNSYATYGQSCRSLGDVAKAMGDYESTVKRFYLGDLLGKEEGEAWFGIAPTQRKIIRMTEAA